MPAAALAGIVAALQGLGFATLADLQATQAQLAAQMAQLPTRVEFQALQAQVAQLPTLAQIQALLVPHNAPAVATAAAATVQAIGAARAENAQDRAEPYAVVPRADGTLPVWPAGFDREALRRGPIVAVDALLAGYGLPAGGTILARRTALALHIGAPRP
jgi:hypothetical protein